MSPGPSVALPLPFFYTNMSPFCFSLFGHSCLAFCRVIPPTQWVVYRRQRFWFPVSIATVDVSRCSRGIVLFTSSSCAKLTLDLASWKTYFNLSFFLTVLPVVMVAVLFESMCMDVWIQKDHHIIWAERRCAMDIFSSVLVWAYRKRCNMHYSSVYYSCLLYVHGRDLCPVFIPKPIHAQHTAPKHSLQPPNHPFTQLSNLAPPLQQHP